MSASISEIARAVAYLRGSSKSGDAGPLLRILRAENLLPADVGAALAAAIAPMSAWRREVGFAVLQFGDSPAAAIHRRPAMLEIVKRRRGRPNAAEERIIAEQDFVAALGVARLHEAGMRQAFNGSTQDFNRAKFAWFVRRTIGSDQALREALAEALDPATRSVFHLRPTPPDRTRGRPTKSINVVGYEGWVTFNVLSESDRPKEALADLARRRSKQPDTMRKAAQAFVRRVSN